MTKADQYPILSAATNSAIARFTATKNRPNESSPNTMDKKWVVGVTSYWVMMRRLDNKIKSLGPSKKSGFIRFMNFAGSDWKRRHSPEFWKKQLSRLPLWLFQSGVGQGTIEKEFRLSGDDIGRYLREDKRSNTRKKLSKLGFDLSGIRLTKKNQKELERIMSHRLAVGYYREFMRFRR